MCTTSGWIICKSVSMLPNFLNFFNLCFKGEGQGVVTRCSKYLQDEEGFGRNINSWDCCGNFFVHKLTVFSCKIISKFSMFSKLIKMNSPGPTFLFFSYRYYLFMNPSNHILFICLNANIYRPWLTTSVGGFGFIW